MKKKMNKKQMKKLRKKIKMYIYQIWFYITNETYIGQTYDIQERHRGYKSIWNSIMSQTRLYRALKQNIGFNEDGSVNGLKYAIVTILEVVEENLADTREIFWIKEKDTFINGLNATRGGSYGPKKTQFKKQDKNKIYQLVDPNGNLHIINDLVQFCKVNQLTIHHIRSVLKGTTQHHKKWTKNSKESLGIVFEYKKTKIRNGKTIKHSHSNQIKRFVNKNGQLITGTIKEISRKHKIKKRWLYLLSAGYVQYIQGWRDANENTIGVPFVDPFIIELVNKKGDIIKGRATELANKYNLNASLLLQVYNGKRRHHNGCRKAILGNIGIPFVDKQEQIIQIINELGVILCGTIKQIVAENKFNNQCFRNFVNGKIKTYRGFKIKNPS